MSKTDAENAVRELEQYKQALMAARMCATLMAVHDIPKMLEAISRSESLGPLLDPTAWIKNHKAMEEDKGLLTAAAPIAALGKSLLERGIIQ
jgi:hypothetical protein